MIVIFEAIKYLVSLLTLEMVKRLFGMIIRYKMSHSNKRKNNNKNNKENNKANNMGNNT